MIRFGFGLGCIVTENPLAGGIEWAAQVAVGAIFLSQDVHLVLPTLYEIRIDDLSIWPGNVRLSEGLSQGIGVFSSSQDWFLTTIVA